MNNPNNKYKQTSNNNIRGKKANKLFIAGIVIPVLVIVIVGFKFLNNKNSNTSTAQTTNATTVDTDLVIKTSDISDNAQFYPVEIGGTMLEVLAVKAPDGTIRTAFNTCQVCYSSGKGYYVQEGDSLVCQNCGNRFSMSEVDVIKGGCNPVPITTADRTDSDSSITISKDYLAQATTIFANWKN